MTFTSSSIQFANDHSYSYHYTVFIGNVITAVITNFVMLYSNVTWAGYHEIGSAKPEPRKIDSCPSLVCLGYGNKVIIAYSVVATTTWLSLEAFPLPLGMFDITKSP